LSRTRARFVAAQVAVVAVLLLIVYLTWIRSDNDDSGLFGVNAPGESDRFAQGPGDRDGRDEPRRGRGELRIGSERGGVNEPRGGVAAGGASEAAPAAPLIQPPGGGTADGDGDTPADEQYSDTVARLIERASP
jgi:hypothetical protein